MFGFAPGVKEMQSEKSVMFFNAVVGNALSRRVLTSLNQQCKKCGENRLEVAMELYVGARQEACLKCKLAEKPLAATIALGAYAFGISEAKVRSTLSNPLWRRGLISVVKGIAAFGVRRPFVPGAPFLVVWDVTYGCNLRCKHCYASAGKPLENELTPAESLLLIDRLAAMGVIGLSFSGGEPLVRPDILELSKHAHDRGMYVSLATNGTLITPEKAKALKAAGVEYLQISVDGVDAATHDSFRGIPGCFGRTIEGIRNAVSENFFVNVSTAVTKKNYEQVPDIIDLCNELGVNWFMAYNFIPTGRGRDMVDLDLTPEMREGLLKMLYEKNKTSKCQVLTTAPQFARVALQQCSGSSIMVPTHFSNLTVEGKLLGLTEFIGGCGAGRFYMAVRADGRIDPCVFLPQTVGNVRNDDLSAIWLHDPLFAKLRDKDLLEDNCGHCDYRYHCGGCRARAYGYFNDPLAPDPGCIRNVDIFNEMVLRKNDREKQGGAP